MEENRIQNSLHTQVDFWNGGEHGQTTGHASFLQLDVLSPVLVLELEKFLFQTLAAGRLVSVFGRPLAASFQILLYVSHPERGIH